MTRNHVPDDHFAIVARRRQKVWRTVSSRHDVFRVTAALSTSHGQNDLMASPSDSMIPIIQFAQCACAHEAHPGLYLSDFHWEGQSFDWRLTTIAGMEVAKLVPWNSLLN